jgi:hemoglobin
MGVDSISSSMGGDRQIDVRGYNRAIGSTFNSIIMGEQTLYARLGGYDAIAAVVGELLGRLKADAQLGRFWLHRGQDGLKREQQLLIDFLCANAGGPLMYTGRDNQTSHRGMKISESDWEIFIGHSTATLDKFQLPDRERGEVLNFIQSTKVDIVE